MRVELNLCYQVINEIRRRSFEARRALTKPLSYHELHLLPLTKPLSYHKN